jgi:hypothetical protein
MIYSSVIRTLAPIVCAVVFAVLGISTIVGSTAHATSSNPKLFVSGDNTFYVYVKGGEKLTTAFTRSNEKEPTDIPPEDATVSLEGPGLALQKCVLPKAIAVGSGCGFDNVVAPQTGIYRIIFKLPDTARLYTQVSPTVRWGANMFSWNITVSDTNGEKPGRLWSELYAIRQPILPEDAVDLVYHYISESGYLYKATYKGYNGQISTLSADAFGIRTGKGCISAYQSIEVSDTKLSPSFGSCGASYKLFYEQPSGDLPQSAKKWDGKQDWINPSISHAVVKDLSFTSDKSSDTQSGKISFTLDNFVGQYVIKVDTDGDGNYDGTSDVKIPETIKKQNSGKQEIIFNGIDRSGQQVPISRTIGVKIQIEKVAEIHLVKADVEGLTGGLELIRLSGDNAPTTRICWDDSNLTPTDIVGYQTPKLSGCLDSIGGVHKWAYATGSWGDMRYIDDWAYATARVDGKTEIRYPEDAEPLAVKKAQNDLAVAVSVAGGIIGLVVIAFIILALRRRKRHMQQLKQAELHQQPANYAAPGDPRPPLQ